MRRAVLAAAALAGCYSPELARCTVQCVGDQACPAGLACAADGFCHAEGEPADCPVPTFEVKVRMTGAGANAIHGPNQLMCVGECTVRVPRGVHRFEARPDADSRLVGWTVDGDPLACGPAEECLVEVLADMAIDAAFDAGHTLRIQLTGDGAGAVRGSTASDPSQIFTCSSSDGACVKRFPPGTVVTLTQAPETPSLADATWGGSCAGVPSSEPCSLTLDNTPATVLMGYDVIHVTMVPFPSSAGMLVFDSHACPPDCTFPFTPNAPGEHIFYAAPNPGAQFDRWITFPSLPCGAAFPCTADPMPGEDLLVIGVFDQLPTLTLVVTGGQVVAQGSTSPAPLVCDPHPPGGVCIGKFQPGETVTLTAIDPTGGKAAFDHWVGATAAGCPSPTLSPCDITMTADTNVTARFRFDVTVRAFGNGRVTFDPGPTTCGPGMATCTVRYLEGTLVTLLQAPLAGSMFGGWTDCPSGDDDPELCTFVVDRPEAISAKWSP